MGVDDDKFAAADRYADRIVRTSRWVHSNLKYRALGGMVDLVRRAYMDGAAGKEPLAAAAQLVELIDDLYTMPGVAGRLAECRLTIDRMEAAIRQLEANRDATYVEYARKDGRSIEDYEAGEDGFAG